MTLRLEKVKIDITNGTDKTLKILNDEELVKDCDKNISRGNHKSSAKSNKE